MKLETVLCSSGFISFSSSSIERKGVPSFPKQGNTVCSRIWIVSVCRVLQLNILKVRVLLQSWHKGDWLSRGISNKSYLLWGYWVQSHLHRFVMELLHEWLWDLHFCTYRKVELTFLHKANLENQSWKEGMWEFSSCRAKCGFWYGKHPQSLPSEHEMYSWTV